MTVATPPTTRTVTDPAAGMFDEQQLADAQHAADTARADRQAAEREHAHADLVARLAHVDRTDDIARALVRVRLGVDPRDDDTIVTTDMHGATVVVNAHGEFTALPAIPPPHPTEPDHIVLAAAALGTVPASRHPDHLHDRAGDENPAPAAAGLGNTKSSVTPPCSGTTESAGQGPETERGKVSAFAMASARRRDRMNLRDLLQEFTNLAGLRACEKKVLGAGVSIRKSAKNPSGFAGVARCASVWACPTCSAVIRGARAVGLQALAQAWLEQGHGLAMATLTVSHFKHAKLGRQIEGVSDAWRRVTRGEPWKRFLAGHGLHGVTRAIEMTHGDNGWHVHLHVLLWFEEGYRETDFAFCDADDPRAAAELADRQRADRVQTDLYERWAKMVRAVKLGKPSKDHGVRVDPARLIPDDEEVKPSKDGYVGSGPKKPNGKMGGAFGAYLVKLQEAPGLYDGPQVGPELARGDTKSGRKKGRTPFQIVAAHLREKHTGSPESKRDLALWFEYEAATCGKKMLTWSDGLRDLLAQMTGVDVDNLTAEDNQLTDQDAPDPKVSVELAYVPRDSWRRNIAKIPGRRAALIEAADNRGTPGIRRLIESWGLTWGIDVLPPRTAADQDADRPPPRPPRHKAAGWKNRDELANLADLTGLTPRDVVRPEQADRRMRGLPIDRDPARTAQAAAATPTAPVCRVCTEPLADTLVEQGHHIGCLPTIALPIALPIA